MLEVSPGGRIALPAALLAVCLAGAASADTSRDLVDIPPWQLARYEGTLRFEERGESAGSLARGAVEIGLELVYLAVPSDVKDAGARLLLVRSAAPRGDHRYELPVLRDAAFLGLRKGEALVPEEVRPALPIDRQLPAEVVLVTELPETGGALRDEAVRVYGPVLGSLPLRVDVSRRDGGTTVTRELEASSPVGVELDGVPAEVEAWQDAHVFDEARKSLLERRREVQLRTSRRGVPITLDAREALRLKEIRVLAGPERERAAALARDVDAALGLFRSQAEPRAIYEKLGGLREAAALVPGLDEALAERLALYRKERDVGVEPPRPAQARKEAPDFTLEGLDGSKVSFRQATKGKVVLLTFWGYGCGPCRIEAPYLTKLQDAYGEKGFTVMAVNAWDEPRGVVERFVKGEGLRHPMLLQGGSVARDVYNVTSFPTSFWIDAEGYIVGRSEVGFSPRKYPSMVAKVESMLGPRAAE